MLGLLSIVTAACAPAAASSGHALQDSAAVAAANPDPASDEAPVDGSYAGTAILLASRGDCNAGGTGHLLIQGSEVRFRDDRNGELEGRLGPDGLIDLHAGPRHLLGGIDDQTFSGIITGGLCDYELAFTRQSAPTPTEIVGFAPPGASDHADIRQGLSAYGTRHPGQAARRFEAAAQAGDPEAAYLLGTLYDTGQGVPQSYGHALEWYRLAALRGSAAGMFNTGLMYDAGRGVARDPAEAARWYAMAAAKGYGRAAYNLALIYESGVGLPRDPRQANRLFLAALHDGIAAARGHVASQNPDPEENSR